MAKLKGVPRTIPATSLAIPYLGELHLHYQGRRQPVQLQHPGERSVTIALAAAAAGLTPPKYARREIAKRP